MDVRAVGDEKRAIEGDVRRRPRRSSSTPDHGEISGENARFTGVCVTTAAMQHRFMECRFRGTLLRERHRRCLAAKEPNPFGPCTCGNRRRRATLTWGRCGLRIIQDDTVGILLRIQRSSEKIKPWERHDDDEYQKSLPIPFCEGTMINPKPCENTNNSRSKGPVATRTRLGIRRRYQGQQDHDGRVLRGPVSH